MADNIVTELVPATKEVVILIDPNGRILTMTPSQFANEKVHVIPRCLRPPLVVFNPEILLEK